MQKALCRCDSNSISIPRKGEGFSLALSVGLAKRLYRRALKGLVLWYSYGYTTGATAFCYSYEIFTILLPGTKWLLKQRRVYIHVGEPSELSWPGKGYHQNHNCLGFVADIGSCHSDNVWHQSGAV
jgi:hypothetical protein